MQIECPERGSKCYKSSKRRGIPLHMNDHWRLHGGSGISAASWKLLIGLWVCVGCSLYPSVNTKVEPRNSRWLIQRPAQSRCSVNIMCSDSQTNHGLTSTFLVFLFFGKKYKRRRNNYLKCKNRLENVPISETLRCEQSATFKGNWKCETGVQVREQWNIDFRGIFVLGAPPPLQPTLHLCLPRGTPVRQVCMI